MKIVFNSLLKPLIIFPKKFLLRSLTGFWISLCIVNVFSWITQTRHTVSKSSFLRKIYLSNNIFNDCFPSLSQQKFRVQSQQKKHYWERFEIYLNLTIKTATLFEALVFLTIWNIFRTLLYCFCCWLGVGKCWLAL